MEEKEFDFREYLFILKKRKAIIFVTTLVFAVVSTVIALFMPKVYRSAVIIEPAKIQKVPIENVSSLRMLIKNPLNPYLKKIANEMGFERKKAYSLGNMFDIIEKEGFIVVSGRGDSPAEVTKLLDLTTGLIIKRQEDLIKDALKISEDEKENLIKQIEDVEKEIKQLETKLVVKEKTDVLAQAYVFQGMIESKENALKRRMSLNTNLRNIDMELKYFTKTAYVVAEPTIPEFPDPTNKKVMVIVSTLIGFFISIFVAFGLEYNEKIKDYFKRI